MALVPTAPGAPSTNALTVGLCIEFDVTPLPQTWRSGALTMGKADRAVDATLIDIMTKKAVSDNTGKLLRWLYAR